MYNLALMLQYAEKENVPEALLFYLRKYKNTEELRANESNDMLAYLAYTYTDSVVKKRNQMMEAYILHNVHYTFNYMMKYIPKNRRWSEGERVLLHDVDYAYAYASQRLGKRWPALEAKLKRYPGYCALYAMNVLKTRWRNMEEIIVQDPYWWNSYTRHFFIPE